MKRLMFLFTAGMFAAFFAQSSLAESTPPDEAKCTKMWEDSDHHTRCKNWKPKGEVRAPLSADEQGRQNSWLYRYQGNVTPFVPGDLAFADPSRDYFNCDENGIPSRPRPNIYSMCNDFVSKQEGSKWRLRKVDQGTMVSIFRISKGGNLKLHVLFAGNGDVHRIVKISPEAEKMAQANGYQFDTASNTMVATNAPAAAPVQALNCSKPANINETLICVKRGGNGAGDTSTASTTPAPPAQGPDCSVLRGVMKVKCDAAASLAKAKGALPDIPTGAIVKQ